MTLVKDGAFYGWPWSYCGQHVDAPVGVAVDKTGGLLVADDTANIIWRVTKR